MQLKSIKTLTKQLSQEIIKNLNQHSENNRFITKHATFHDSPTESSLRYRQVLTQHRKCNPRFSVDSLRIFSYSSLQLSYSEWNYNIKDMKFASCGGNRGGWKEVDIELLKHVVGYTPTNASFLFLVRSLFWCFFAWDLYAWMLGDGKLFVGYFALCQVVWEFSSAKSGCSYYDTVFILSNCHFGRWGREEESLSWFTRWEPMRWAASWDDLIMGWRGGALGLGLSVVNLWVEMMVETYK